MIVAGRTVARRGKLTGIDYDAVQAELLDRLRHGIKGNDALRTVLPELGRALHRHFAAAPCC